MNRNQFRQKRSGRPDNRQNRGGGHRGSFSRHFGGGSGRPKFERPNIREPVVVSNLKEDQVFITEYITAGEGFHGILKSRFSDFQVNEIDSDGKVAVLTDLGLPAVPSSEEKSNVEVEQELAKLISQESVDRIRKVAEFKGKCTDIVKVDVTEMSKENRGTVHNSAKTLFGKAIVGSTVTKDEKKFITFAAFDKSKVRDRREKWLWPHPFTYFMLYKENVDTIQATTTLAEALKCSPSAFAYAGTKDRRAKTTQWISVKLFEPSKIAAAAARIRQLSVGNFCFKPTTLKLGQLRGNRFRIALRQVSAEEAVIRKSLESFQETGFINYYGLQRFGNSATVPTYKIGIELLKGCWKEACELILMPRDGDHWYMRACRLEWEKTHDAKSALNKLSNNNKSIEKQILEWLVAHKNDFKGALEQISRNMRLLYYHSYQSLVWNRVASRRIKEFGHRLIAGDLVYVDKAVEEAADAKMAVKDLRLELQISPEDDEQDRSTETSAFKNLVKPLTEADIESGQYTIFDIVLPLPGHDISYPANDCGKWYEEILAEDELSSEKLKGKQRKESLGGAYRKVFGKPENLQWKMVSYENPHDDLIVSDLETLKGAKEPEAKEGATKKALLLDFHLPSAAYATMALREILKVDTSALTQLTLQHKDRSKSDSQTDVESKPQDEEQQQTTEEATADSHTTEVDDNDASPQDAPSQEDEEPAAKKAKQE